MSNPLIHNPDGSTRFFKCDFEGGCDNDSLTACVDAESSRIHVYCPTCGYDFWLPSPTGFTNPNGSGSIVGGVPF
jgi:hypothetical protein